jgi:hypothetical protein
LPPEGTSAEARLTLLDRLEEWIYRLNDENHWIFRVYDWGNEVWARMFLRGVRRRGLSIDEWVEGSKGRARVRCLGPDDVDAFAGFLAALDVRYLPPHPLDRRAAEQALGRQSYVPLGIFWEDELVGYVLVRLFFFRRAVNGIWMLPAVHGQGLGKRSLWVSAKVPGSEAMAGYCTIPLGNEPSVRSALWCGYEIIRTNRRFHVLKLARSRFDARWQAVETTSSTTDP